MHHMEFSYGASQSDSLGVCYIVVDVGGIHTKYFIVTDLYEV